MAITKNYNLNLYNDGMEINNAYFVITRFEGFDTMNLYIGVYCSREDYKNNKSPLAIINYSFSPDYSDEAKNLKKQSYDYLSTLEYFQDAIPVLEEGQTA